MFNIIKTVSEKNLDHAINHPGAHTAMTCALAGVFATVVGVTARKLGERDLENKKDAFVRKWS